MRALPFLLMIAPVPLAAVAALASASRPPAEVPVPIAARDAGTATLTPDTEARWVPFDLTPGNQIRFTMTLDGRPVTAILDTGVSYSVLGRGSPAVDATKLKPGGSATAIGGAVPIDWMPTQTLAVGGLVRTGGGVTVAQLPALATGSSTAVDLLVGRDLIGAQALDIDYENRRFRLLLSGRMPFVGSVAPLSVSPARRVYESELTLGNRRLRPVVVDTGDGSSITVSRGDWTAAGLSRLPTTTAISFGLAGSMISDLAVVPGLKLGQLVAREVETRIEPANGFSQSIGTAGRVGSGFLQNYRVLLDPGAGRMVLKPGPKAYQPPLRSTSGLLVGLVRDRLRVLHVMRGGPAAAAGWHDGDEICTINGQPIPADYPGSTLATWSVGAPGTRVTLGLCDGETRLLTLARFY
ncbi:hypothetical protein SAMN05192583_0325 [Sphingomonas gellani]|uniref:Aspartyl protease n=1 Tax=Sphingomonas gellani TaxID=1166340 RepID=A0A1H7YLU8_9SPHN|nr:hypothetical protein [Sphingomonas gellani]SEM47206.1 hypothetical protein SAMN05192583_0325 [Sphingomonas gellani]